MREMKREPAIKLSALVPEGLGRLVESLAGQREVGESAQWRPPAIRVCHQRESSVSRRAPTVLVSD